MRKVSFSFPPEIVEELDRLRGTLSRNRFVLRLLERSLREGREEALHRITAQVYGDGAFASEEEQLVEAYGRVEPEP